MDMKTQSQASSKKRPQAQLSILSLFVYMSLHFCNQQGWRLCKANLKNKFRLQFIIITFIFFVVMHLECFYVETN